MIRLLVRAVVFFGAAALGLYVTSLLVDGVALTAEGFLIVVLLFAVIQTVISPFIARVAARNAEALLGGVGLLAAFVALLAATLVGDALTISGGVNTWIAATVVVWLTTALATLTLPILLLRVGRGLGKERRREAQGPRRDRRTGTDEARPAPGARDQDGGGGDAPR